MGSKRAAATSDLVFLIPGFLGFERFGNLGYFADRVTAALRACLEDRLQHPVHVVPVPILPTGSFAQRQAALVKTLSNRMAAFENVGRVHLIGHSTGGIDAQLLTLARPLDRNSWGLYDGIDARPLRDRLRTVVSIGTPHQGTCLADDVVAKFLAHPLRGRAGALPFGVLLGKLVMSAAGEVSASEVMLTLGREGHKVWKFFFEVLRWNDLIDELTPASMDALYRSAPPDLPDVRRASFVTVAGLADQNPPDGQPDTDAFFDDMWRRTAGGAARASSQNARIKDALTLLRGALWEEGRVVANPEAAFPCALDLTSNDGIVNTAHQLIDPNDPREFAALVVADHFDVIGYYDRSVWVTDENGADRPHRVMAGLLHSGSMFGDDEFFQLYRRVAHVIAGEARG
jgi:pimeloyl-ACP methyl ester carboxylesterase